MKIKHILIGSGILIMGFEIGKLYGYIRCAKNVWDMSEEVFPGMKKQVVKDMSDKVIDHIFDSKEEEES